MAQSPIFEGSWDPSTGAFPIVPSSVTSAYYLVTGAGKVGNFSFGEGDWLIYLEEEGTAPNTGSWYRTTGGIIQLATTTQQASFTAADISDFAAAVNSAIIVDNTTIVKEPSTGELKVIAGAGQTQVIDEDDDEDDTYVAPHGHVSTDVSDFVSAVRTALGPTSANTPFFSNTALTNAVVFSYNNSTHTVSADVKIDNQTIIKNKYGQLVAGKPQPMAITDILGLTDYLNNYVSQFADPTTQKLGATAPNGSAWKPAGYHDFTEVKIGDAFYLLNVDVVDLKKSIADLNASFAGVIPVPPPALSSSVIPILDPSVTFHEAYLAGASSPTVIGVTLDTTPPTLPTAPFFKGFSAGPAGTLEVFIDGASAGKITQLDSGVDQTGVTAGALTITEDQDSYLAEPAFHNLFKSVRVKIEPKVNLKEGRHVYSIQEVLPGLGTFNSGSVSVDVDIPADPDEMDILAVPDPFSPMPSAHFVSGVPVMDTSFLYHIPSITAEGVVGYTYGRNIARVSGYNTLIDTEADLPAASVPVKPAVGTYGDAVTGSFSFHVLDEYNENAAINIYPYNSIGVIGHALTIPLGRVDNTTETNRVYSGDPNIQFPSIDTTSGCGSPWKASKSLVSVEYSGELQKLRKVYQWPVGNYTSIGGPDYTDATGTWRWVTLKLASGVVGRVAFTLSFIGGNTDSWTCDPYTRSTDGIRIYAKLGNSGWVDCNSPYRGLGVADTNGASSMDVAGHQSYETTAKVKRVTLGPSSANASQGDLYVRVALPKESTKQFADILVSDWA